MRNKRQTRKDPIDVQLAQAGGSIGSRNAIWSWHRRIYPSHKARAFFTAIGDPEKLFPPKVLRDMLDLTRQLSS